ncbi:hypothetical protein [Solicola sp. PLA-1-18]|uniref:hypothetical protein n=1 Tax=Solicola sp. PLA-1-18 TaxID=3380532 RepID=UPI003B7C220C
MDDVNQWGVLLSQLGRIGCVTEIRPGHLKLTFADVAGKSITVDIWLSREQWNEMVSVLYGGYVDQAVEQVRGVLEQLKRERHLVYGQYELVASTTPDLPADYLF